jgi:PAS domain S-box-containing protein
MNAPRARGWLRSWRRRPARGTVRAKLMRLVLLTTGLAVLIAGAAMLAQDFKVYRKSWADNLSNEAQILALSTAPALEFDDFEVAARNLDALQARPQVLVAALYSLHGSLYASYVRPGAAPPPARAPAIGLRMSSELIEIAQPVERKGEALGVIYLRARYDLWNRLASYLGIFVLVTASSVAFAYVFSSQLQRGITEPLDAMAAVARQVVSRRDYSLRARKQADDEIGVVVDAFNKMLEEVESRSQALERTNLALEEEVAVRKSTEVALSVATARLESTMAAAEIGSWQWDVRGNEFSADRNLAALFGLAEGALDGDPQLHHRYIHPEDLAAVLDAEKESIRIGSLAATEFRICLPEGVEKWVARRGRVQFAADGNAVVVSGLLIDITAQKRAERALREADRRKDEFLAILAHELRNPLAPIRHAVRLLETKTVSERQQQWARDVISRQVQRMALLLDDLLDVSRITRGRLNLKFECVTLDSLVEAAVETARPLIEAKQHHLSVQLPLSPVRLSVDPLRISQSLSNLLTNAAKYTDARGMISLGITLDSSGLLMSVKDSGIGFEPKATPNMFEMFSQLDSAIDRAEGGLGIGLALVRGLIELHGGTVAAHSAGLGFGSEFTIHLPREVVMSEPPPPADLEGAAVIAGPESRLTVLVADDNRDAAESLGMVLELGGHDVLVANSGQQALQMARQRQPHVVILDIGMPDMNGYEVAREIRRDPWGANVMLLAITGWGQREDKERARDAGFDHHLTKPVDADRVEQLIRTYSVSSPAA